MNERKNATESIYSRTDQTEDRIINDLEDSQRRIREKEERMPT